MRTVITKIWVGLLPTVTAAVILLVSCSKGEVYVREKNSQESVEQQCSAIGFSLYNPSVPTKASPVMGGDILGRWIDSTSTFIPGTGIGIFAFYQPAKSNGYPLDFNKSIVNNPKLHYMSNQKLERTTSDGKNYSFVYDPKKYWPNTKNDQLSFFAYAPYDSTAAWEDLQIETDLKGAMISRNYTVEDNVSDQTDFIWTDPVLNQKKPSDGSAVHFNLRHLCSRISVTAVVNITPYTPYLTVDTLSFIGRFNVSGTWVYDVATSTSGWKNICRASEDKVYYPFREEYTYDPALGRDTSNAIRVTKDESLAHPEDSYMFLLPGTQDITFHYSLSQRNPNTGDAISVSGDSTYPSMTLEAGKAYNFKLNVTLKPISISNVTVINVDLEEQPQYIP